MKILFVTISLMLLAPLCSAQEDTSDLYSTHSSLVSMADSLEQDMTDSGLLFSELSDQMASIRHNLRLAKSLIDQGHYIEARTMLLQASSNLSVLRQDFERARSNIVSPGDPVIIILISVVVASITALYLILARMKKNPYKSG
jgi:hypothetical protein